MTAGPADVRSCEGFRTSGDVRLESAKRAKADIDQVAVTNRDFMGACLSNHSTCHRMSLEGKAGL